MSEEVDHDYVDEIVCPYCWHKFQDSWDHVSDIHDGYSTEMECINESCEKKFRLNIECPVKYTTEKLKDD